MEVTVSTNTKFILSTSGSPVALKRHNEALKRLGVDIVYFTFSRKITAEQYAGLFKSPIVRGGAVTGQGLKTGIIPFVDHVDPIAKKFGSINTIVNIMGELYGYNTDAHGFRTALTDYLNRSGESISSAVVYGNGGVSGVAVMVLQEMGLRVGMAGRNLEHVSHKMQELGLKGTSGPYDLVINATPVSSSPIEQAEGLPPLLKTAKLVFDHSMPELNNKTNYLEEYCQKHGLSFIPGKDMYTPQLATQWKLFLDGVESVEGKTTSITEDDIKKAWKL
jgi:shikimate dehydrogenase